MEDIKKQVRAEILALLDAAIDNEIALSGDVISNTEIAREVLLQAPEVAKL